MYSVRDWQDFCTMYKYAMKILVLIIVSVRFVTSGKQPTCEANEMGIEIDSNIKQG